MTQRSYTIEFHAHPNGLRAHVTGVASFENTISYWSELVSELMSRKVDGLLLIDELVGPPLSAEQWFSLVQAMEGRGLESVRIAHVKPRGLELVEYCEIYAREAGIEARVFVDEYAANIWLRYGEREPLRNGTVS